MIEKYVVNLGMVASGALLVAKSGIPTTIKQWVQDGKPRSVQKIEIDGSMLKAESQESSAKKALRWGVAAASLFAICYGVYNIALAVLPPPPVLPSPPVLPPPLPLDSTQTAIPLCSRPDLWPEYEANIAKALDSCSATRKMGVLAKDASLSNNRPPWHIKIVPRDSEPFGAAAAYSVGEVRIACDAREPVSFAAFELTNFCQQNHFYELFDKAILGQIGRDEYAKLVTETEFNGTQIHHSAMAECMEELEWKRGVQLSVKAKWENAWPFFSNHPHTEWIKRQWDELSAAAKGLGFFGRTICWLTKIFFPSRWQRMRG